MKKYVHSITHKLFTTIFFFLLSIGTQAQETTVTDWSDNTSQPDNYSESSATITIKSAEELAWLAKQVNDEHKDFSNVTITLNADLDLAAHNWTPIGKDSRYSFKGIFEGGGKTISNMKIKTDYAAGLFGHINGATIKNIYLTNCFIEKIYNSSLLPQAVTNNNTGCIAAQNNLSKIENCSAKGDINYKGDVAIYAGGIVGKNNGGTINQCDYEGSLCYENTKETTAGYVGGIAGSNPSNGSTNGTITASHANLKDFNVIRAAVGGITAINNGIIENCTTEGNIEATTYGATNYVGGITGQNHTYPTTTNPSIKGCKSTCNIYLIYYAEKSINNLDGARVGGIAGYQTPSSSLIKECTSSGTISVELKTTQPTETDLRGNACFAGGIIGLSKILNNNNTGAIENCTSSANVSAFTNIASTEAYAGGIVGFTERNSIKDSKATGTVTANGPDSYAGGIAGYTSADITDCHSEASVQIGENKTSFLPSTACIGGIVGQVGNGNAGKDAIIRNCSATGSIYAKATECYIGGIVGINLRKIENCYVTADICSEGNTNYAGGIVGHNYKINDGGLSCNIQNCYTTGNITSTGAISRIGGIAGVNEDIVLNCYSTGKLEAIVDETKIDENTTSYVGGIVGENMGTVENCLSLNTAGIINNQQNGKTGRIIGNQGASTTTSSNNVAHSKIPGTWPEDENINGQNWDESTYPFSSSNAWNFPNARLPQLKKMTGDNSYSDDDMVANQPEIPLLGLQSFTITFQDPENGTLKVLVNGKDIATGDQVPGGTILTITATANELYQLDALLVNDQIFSSGNTFKVSSETTISATFSKIPDPKPEPTPEPTPEPEPAPVYYLVTLPSIEGATTDPVAGDYEIEAWDSFRFYLTIDTAYSQSEPIVTTDRGETIEPRSNGAYIINFVRSDIQISIDGIVKNPDPVANETIETNDTKVWAESACLHIHTAKRESILIYSYNGTLLNSFTLLGDQTVYYPQGNYIVVAGGKRFKVQVK